MTNEFIFCVIGLALGFMLGWSVHQLKDAVKARKYVGHINVPHNCFCEHKDRTYVKFADGLSLIFEDGKYIGFYTQKPCDK